MAGPDSSYEQVRRKLLERGYLDGRIQRFVLGDLVRPGSGAWKLFRSAMKASLLGGPLLGAMLAGVAAAGNRPLLGPGDVALLWLYFALPAAVGLLLLDLATAFGVSAIARHRGARPGDAVAAGLLVGLATLAYVLLLWGRQRNAGGPAADLAFLAFVVAATVGVAWLAGLVSLTGIVGRTGEVPVRRRRAVLLVLVCLLGVAGVGWVARPWFGGDGVGARAPSDFVPAPRSRRLLVIGVDGLDGDVLQAFEPRGVFDRLLAAMARGAVFPIRRSADLQPPQVWTTLMTGVPAEIHGVRAAGGERLPGIGAPLSHGRGAMPLAEALRFLLPTRTVPTTGSRRRVRTAWEIIGLRRPAVAVNWWASWPALADPASAAPGGYLLTDRVLPKLLSGAPGDRDTWPSSLYPRLAGEFEDHRGELRREFEARFPELGEGSRARWLWESFLIDAFAWEQTRRLMADPSVEAGFVYMPGLDILRFRLDRRAETSRIDSLLGTQAALEAYVGWLDAALGPVLDTDQGWQTVLLADPGRGAAAGAEGFAVVLGPAVERGCVGSTLSLLDVLPLVLELAGYPPSAEMAGHPPGDCRVDGTEATQAPIATYGHRPIGEVEVTSDYDPEMVERLRSLGYLN